MSIVYSKIFNIFYQYLKPQKRSISPFPDKKIRRSATDLNYSVCTENFINSEEFEDCIEYHIEPIGNLLKD